MIYASYSCLTEGLFLINYFLYKLVLWVHGLNNIVLDDFHDTEIVGHRSFTSLTSHNFRISK